MATHKKDFFTAVIMVKNMAKNGDARAQNNLGIMYETGYGVPQDYTEAVKWYQAAANQGHAAAQFNLGTMYEKGRGVPQDDAQAAKWFRLAAEQGYAEGAQPRHHVCHWNGRPAGL